MTKTIETSPTVPLTLPFEGYTRWSTLRHYVPFSRETLRQYELAGHFPKRTQFSSRCAAWPNRELHRYFDNPADYKPT